MQKNPLIKETKLVETNGGGVHNFTNLLSNRLTAGNAVHAGLYSTVVMLE